MPHKKQIAEKKQGKKIPPKLLKSLLKSIGNLNRTGMEAGNSRNFDTAFSNIEYALSLSRDLNKKCLEAKLLNNLGLLYTMNGTIDKAMAAYDDSLNIVSDHYGTQNYLYKTLQKNIGYLFKLDVNLSV